MSAFGGQFLKTDASGSSTGECRFHWRHLCRNFQPLHLSQDKNDRIGNKNEIFFLFYNDIQLHMPIQGTSEGISEYLGSGQAVGSLHHMCCIIGENRAAFGSSGKQIVLYQARRPVTACRSDAWRSQSGIPLIWPAFLQHSCGTWRLPHGCRVYLSHW